MKTIEELTKEAEAEILRRAEEYTKDTIMGLLEKKATLIRGLAETELKLSRVKVDLRYLKRC